MRRTRVFIYLVWAAMLAVASGPAVTAGEQSQPPLLKDAQNAVPAPRPFNRNAAMPRQEDLIRFDDSPIRPDQIVELDELDTIQAAFPLYYGARPVTPSSGRYDAVPPMRGPGAPPILPPPPRATGAQPFPGALAAVPGGKYDGIAPAREEGTADIVAPVSEAFVSAGSAHITTTSSGEGFVDYQEYLNRARARDMAQAAVTPPAAAPASPAAREQALIPPPPTARPPVATDAIIPPPPPQELLDQARTEQARLATPAPDAPMLPPPPPETPARQTPTAVPVPVPPTQMAVATPPPTPPEAVATATPNTAMEPLPLPPPPLPDMPDTPSHRAPRPDLIKVRNDFNKLRELCETDNLGSAAEVFAGMPDFGQDEELNRIRADAANLLILALSRNGNLPAARRIYESLPEHIVGFEATLAKARAIINLTTYYVRAEQYNDAYAVLMNIGSIQNRSALNNELFRLMARMIPYLDNAEETEKAQTVFDLLLREVKSPGTAALFADNAHGIIRYYLHYVDRSESPQRRGRRMDVLEHIYDSLGTVTSNPDIADLRKGLGMDLAERFAGEPRRAARFRTED